MIPALVAGEVRETVLDYLKTTWSLSDRKLEAALFDFLQGRGPDGEDTGTSIFRGPYLRIRLPFAPKPKAVEVPLEIHPPYDPYLHQLQAWQRLSSREGHEPEATLVTTGTGSGKTECFLYPILDHCYRYRAESGIKAIVLYPMNALASDQARRIAEIVHQDERLSGRLRVGLFVGGDGQHSEMGRSNVVDKQDPLRRNPPDILLTNYRMLDYLLVRPKDQPLWAKNRPGSLRYLVLDELHTYDGAQGTDVACLIRRLTARLGGHDALCPVGTSATVVSDGGSSHRELIEFAAKVFDQPFDDDALVGETRVSPQEFFEPFGGAQLETYPKRVSELEPEPQQDVEQHVRAAAARWFPAGEQTTALPEDFRVALGREVLRHPLGRAIVRAASDRIVDAEQLDARLLKELPELSRVAPDDRRQLVTSALSILSWSQRLVGKRRVPLVQVQVQLWVREARRLLREVSEEPRFYWGDERSGSEGPPALPMYHCRECGHSGWLTRFTELNLNRVVDTDYGAIARGYMSHHRGTLYLHTDSNVGEDDEGPVGPTWLSLKTRALLAKEEPGALRVYEHTALSKGQPQRDLQRCPACDADSGLSMLASRSASLASVAVGHLYTTPLNTDRKLLAFSDSVQDASHRAGFFSGRTYRFSIRSAMLAVVPDEGTIALSDVAARMFEYWSSRVTPGEKFSPMAAMLAAFLPHDLEFLPEYQEYKDAFLSRAEREREAQDAGNEDWYEPLPVPSDGLVDNLRARMRWEVTREFGVAVRIGRTLERTGCASVTLDDERFADALQALMTHVRQRVGVANDAGDEALRQFLVGLINRVRRRGGIFDPLLQEYFESGGNAFHLSKARQPLLSPFGQFTTRPAFLTNRQSKHFDNIAPRERGNWFSDWLTRSLGLSLPLAEVKDVYAEVLPRLVKAGVFLEQRNGSKAQWGLDPEALQLSRHHAWRACDVCGLEQATVAGSVLDPEGHPCLRYRCSGRLRAASRSEERAQSYYRQFYERRALGRVWSREHTGLLERRSREDLEVEFKERPRPDAPNMLSCTPTLEMGIDIGDLSATMLCSVPPSTSSYLQRVGRAGRSTGNALVLTFASTRQHDLYFYEDPIAVMEGAVRPPGCYLDAPEVLKRQALAYCFDRWAASGGKLPGRVREMLGSKAGDEAFPNPILAFIHENRSKLTDGFFELFGRGAVRIESRRKLEAMFDGSQVGESPLERRLQRAVEDARARRDELRALERRARDRRQKLETDEVAAKKEANLEEALRELKAEQGYLVAELTSLLDKDLWGWLCDESLLPNYAFPEAGVVLRAFVRSERGPEGDGSTASKDVSWTRAPATAIRELAPFNTFYGSGYKVQIQNIDLARELPPKWQFCISCHHMEPVAELSDGGECPGCGAAGWGERGRQRQLIQMTQVRSFARERDAVVSDETEDRQRAYYETHNFYDVSGAASRNAWSSEQVGFGFEMLPSVRLRRLNFGQDDPSADESVLAGRSVADVKFLVCAECGQVHPGEERLRSRRSAWFKHRASCPSKSKDEKKQKWREIHLLRELESEGLRLVLPISSHEAEQRVANVRAALRLGLREFYGGDPEFLGVDAYDEPSPEQEDNVRRRYLMIQDMVPGGTGLLAELAEDKGRKLKEVLERAHQTLRRCQCNKRGPLVRACYRCLYAYQEQDYLHLLDRDVACDVLEQMLSAFDDLAVPPGGSIGKLPLRTLLESELEERFYATLLGLPATESDVAVEQLEGQQLRINVGERRWRYEPQVTLGEDVVLHACRPDFILYPEGQEPDVEAVAGFADGATYHVLPGEPEARIGDDYTKRAGVVSSRRFVTWSFAWDDLKAFSDRDDLPAWIEHAAIAAATRKIGAGLRLPFVEEGLGDPVRGLMAYLRNPLGWPKLAACYAVALLHTMGKQLPEAHVDKVLLQLAEHMDPAPAVNLAVPGSDTSLALAALGASKEVMLLLAAPKAVLGKLHTQPESVRGVLRLNDTAGCRKVAGFVPLWRQFLRMYNLLQFLPNVRVVTSEQVGATQAHDARRRNTPYEPTGTQDVVLQVAERSRLSPGVQEHLDEIDDDRLRRLVGLLAGRGHNAFEVPHEVMGPRGAEGQVTVGWPEARVAIYYDDERSAAERLRADGWTIFKAEAELRLDELLAVLGGGA